MNPVKVNYFDMKPKEKANELFTKMKGFRIMHSHSLKCAKVAVNEIINSGLLEPQIKRHIGNVPPTISQLEFWFEVLKELKK